MKKKISTALLGLLSAQTVMAVPTIYPTDTTHLSRLQNSTNSNLVADTADKHTFWVMPPNTGRSKVGKLHLITANNGFCSEMADLQKYSRETSAKIDELTERDIANQEKLEAKTKQISDAKIDLAKFANENGLNEIQYIDGRIEAIEDKIEGLNDLLSSCTQNCSELRSQSRELRAEKRAEQKRRREFVRQNRELARIYSQKEKVVEALETEYEDLEGATSKLRLKLFKVRNTYLELFSSFAKMEGASATIRFSNKWEKNLTKLREENPHYSFNKIQTQNAIVTTSMLGVDGLPGSQAILSYSMGMHSKDGAVYLPSYPEETSGNIVLSLLGSCPMLHPDDFKIPTDVAGNAEMDYGLTVAYEYPSAFKIDAVAKYNMHKMYKKIVKSKKRGGFFSSSRKTSVEERTFFKDSFKVEWKEQDAAHTLSSEEKAELEREWRNAIMGRLAMIGLPSAVSAGNLQAPQAPQIGATVLGNSLQNNRMCQTNVYCMGAAIGFKVLGSIFGGSTATNSYTNIQDVESEEKWSREKVIFKPWISTYQ